METEFEYFIVSVLANTLGTILVIVLFLLIARFWIHRFFKRELENFKVKFIKKVFQHKVILEEHFKKYSDPFEMLELALLASSEFYQIITNPPNWSSLTKEDLKDLLERENATCDEISEFISLFQKDKKMMIKKLNHFKQTKVIEKAKSNLLSAKNKLTSMGIWLDEKIEKKIEAFLKKLSKSLEHIEHFLKSSEEHLLKKGKDIHHKLDKELKEVKSDIRKFLSR